MAYKIKIIAVGRIKQRFYKEAIDEYLRRLKPFCKVLFEEVEEMGNPLIEGDNILKAMNSKSPFIALDEKGKILSSLDFSKELENIFVYGGEPHFVLGGVKGLSEEVKRRAMDVWSLSRLTFTHELARLVLVEQIYRAFKIMRGEPYHY